MPSSAVMHKWKAGTLHSGSKTGPVVKNRAQAIAIMLSEKRAEGQHGGKYPERADGGDVQNSVSDPTGGTFAPADRAGPDLYSEKNERWHNDPRSFGFRSLPGLDPWLDPIAQTASGYTPRYTTTDKWDPYFHRAMGGPAGFGAAPITPPMMPAGMSPPMEMPNLGGMQNAMPTGLGSPLAGRPMGYAYGGVPVYSPTGLSPGWVARQEARNMTHVGPIVSTVAGRTDHHPMSVPSGSYVLPAAHVSALGQGNTLAGMKVLHGMFGSPMSMKRGPGAPRPPSPFKQQSGLGGIKLPSSLTGGLGSSFHAIGGRTIAGQPIIYRHPGGVGNDNTGKPVPIMAAGGEFVLSPDQVARVGGGDVGHGHAVLDRWVEKTHKKYAKTVANLPPPAKD